MKDLDWFANDIEARCVAIQERLGIDQDRALGIALALLSHGRLTLAEACEAEYASLVNASAQLTSAGYSIGPIQPDEVAALYVVAAELALREGASEALHLLDAQSLLGEATFMLSRSEVAGGTRAEAHRLERLRRVAAGEKGGRPPAVDDAAVSRFFVAWQQAGRPYRGSVKEAARQFGVSEKVINGALRRLRPKPSLG